MTDTQNEQDKQAAELEAAKERLRASAQYSLNCDCDYIGDSSIRAQDVLDVLAALSHAAQAKPEVPDDTARLDWLQSTQDGVYRVTESVFVYRTDGSHVREKNEKFVGWSCSLHKDECPTIREAIDKAMLPDAPKETAK